MNRMASLSAGLLLFLSAVVLADDHTSVAFEHAKAAVVNGGEGQTPSLLEHAKMALDHTLAASLVAKGVPKNHLDAAAKELQESIDLASLGHIGSATTHAEAAVKHISAGSNDMDSVTNIQGQ